MHKSRRWYALYTKSRAEKKVYIELKERGMEVYLPLVKTLRQWSDRKKKVEIPLIPSYVFVFVNQKEYRKALEVNGAVCYITFEGKPVPIPEDQINILKLVVENKMPAKATQEDLLPGKEVKIISGPLKGKSGEIMETGRQQRFLVRIAIGFNLIVDIEGARLEAL